MGNCQTIDNADLLIQHPNGKVEKLYSAVTATQIMKMNPGHYVALLLTTTTTMSPPSNKTTTNTNISPIRITRIKLLKPTDTLVLGHIYRLVTAQEVMKGLCAKKYAKQKQFEYSEDKITQTLHSKTAVHQDKVIKHEKHRKSIGAKSRAWHPSLQSISEAAD
ncbi:uncharacterized protein LOC107814253 [Nicotiana tabacum]|uniref:Uncharacterized protein LOC107814253 n=2 Tax=Nicotiana TaxID=4085 RepID=A0A1S4C1T4_TOBAC|nr:PREDICTED: uncharacterized protein LOC104212441 [Nicotiana sylvestris]XP_016495115.1 PREDICTED: uncharacterized protein LOC107814253 [Nicotiana tabacum]